MRGTGQILDAVEEIYARGVLARTSDSGTALHPMAAGALALQRAPPGVEFSPTEYTVLEALWDQREIQEKELEKILAEKGSTRLLVKAVIRDIVRKTGIVGVLWVEVRELQGRCYYRLRAEAVLNLNEQPLERH